MIRTLITRCEIESDIRTITAQERAYRKKIQKTMDNDDVCGKLTQLFSSQGYDITFSDDKTQFVATIDSHFNIYGNIHKKEVEVGIQYDYNGIHSDTEHAGVSSSCASCGFIKLEREIIDRYAPLFQHLINKGKNMTEKYDSLMKIQKKAELLEVLIKPQMDACGIENVEVEYDNEGNFFICKTRMGIRLKAAIDFSNYMDVCGRLAHAFSRFPSLPIQLDTLKIRFDNNYGYIKPDYINPDYINPLNYSPENIKMIYADGNNIPLQVAGVEPSVANMLNRWQFRYSYHNEEGSIKISINEFLSLIRKDDTIFFRIHLDTPEDTRCENGVDDEHLEQLLYLIALASQNGGIQVSLSQCADIDSVSDMLSTFLPVLIPSGMVLDLYLTSHILIEPKFQVDIPTGPFHRFIEYLYLIIVNIEDFVAIKNVWELEPDDSSVSVFMEYLTKWESVK